jgi:hypothetical protein
MVYLFLFFSNAAIHLQIAALSSLVANVAKSTETTNVIDVGAGKGYLGLVLSFEYRMAVVAVDACAHHSNVTNERATRIEKHYNAQLRKTQQVGVDYSSKELCVPRTVTCCVGSGETHTALASLMLALHNQSQELEEPMLSTADHNCINEHPSHLKEGRSSTRDVAAVLAGLHACGDLSATMLRYLPVVLSPPPSLSHSLSSLLLVKSWICCFFSSVVSLCEFRI